MINKLSNDLIVGDELVVDNVVYMINRIDIQSTDLVLHTTICDDAMTRSLADLTVPKNTQVAVTPLWP